jgi:hypothetical protein
MTKNMPWDAARVASRRPLHKPVSFIGREPTAGLTPTAAAPAAVAAAKKSLDDDIQAIMERAEFFLLYGAPTPPNPPAAQDIIAKRNEELRAIYAHQEVLRSVPGRPGMVQWP